MSTWTHIAGALRYDGYGSEVYAKYNDINNILIPLLGNTCSPGDGPKTWYQCNVPRGSEGSIEYYIVEGKENDIGLADVIVFGDLRDFSKEDNWQSVRDWFKTITEVSYEKHGLTLRQGVLQMISGDNYETLQADSMGTHDV